MEKLKLQHVRHGEIGQGGFFFEFADGTTFASGVCSFFAEKDLH
jgi:hypothetical protein